MPATDRFDEKVRRAESGCWLFVGMGTNNGYGLFSVGRKAMTAHRFQYERHLGPIPPGMDVCHKCDVRRCVNPAHLFVGTRGDNMRDCKAKGRTATGPRPSMQGEKHHQSKLSSDEVVWIRQWRAAGTELTLLANTFGVSIAQISRICKGQSWAHT